MSFGARARTSLRIAAVLFAAALLVSFSAGAQLTPAEQTQMVNAHNGVRSAVYPAAVPPLGQVIWNGSLAATAQSWASQCIWGHSNTPGVGENIAASTGSMSMQGVVDLWASETAVYDYWANDWWPDAGHYSQIIWRSSTGLGCGYTNCSFGHYFVCQYSPPGNWSGEYPYQCDYGSGWEVCQAQSACNDGLDNDGDGSIDYPNDRGCKDASDSSEREWTRICDNGVDNDGDGLIDYPDDPGCYNSSSLSENPQCQDGLDNDEDGMVDYPDDPGCLNAFWLLEGSLCQNGIDDDGDTLIDFDGGQSIHGQCSAGTCPPEVSDPDLDGVADPDPECVGAPTFNETECGLGLELAFLVPPLMWLYGRRRTTR